MSRELANQLPKTQGWVSSQEHYFAPLDMSVEGQRAVATYLIKHDPVLTKLIRDNCARQWGIALRVGKYTAHLRVFDLDTARADITPYTGCEGSVFKVTDKRVSMHDASDAETRQIMQCRPSLYADRNLTESEIAFINDIADLYPIKSPLARQALVA